MHIYIMKSSNGQYYVDFTGSNGQIIAVTETYTTKASARHAADVIKREASTAPISDIS